MKRALLGTVLLLAPLSPAAAADPPTVVVAVARGGIVQLDPTTGARQRLLVAGATDPAVSPDGTRLAFALPDGRARQLWVSDLDGTDRVRLTSGPALSSTPDWSPDGTRLALTRRPVAGGPSSIAVLDADGTDGHLVPGTENGYGPTWSPDGTLLAFGGPAGEITLLDADGRHADRLGVGGRPDWSPDGRELLRAVEGDDGALLRYDLRTGRSRTITEFEGYHVSWQHGVWTPDGQALYADIGTESFPDEHASTTIGSTIERRSADGTRDGAFDSGDPSGQVAVGGGARPARDLVPPLEPVSATPTVGPMRLDLRTSVPQEPDGAGVVVRFAPGETPPATPTDGQPGGRSVRGWVSLLHLAPSTTYAVSVWPLDWSGNVGPRTTLTARTPKERPTTLDLRAPAGSEVTYGQTRVLTGRLLEDGTQPVANALLTLLGHVAGAPDTVLARVRTDESGDVELPRVPSENTRYTLRFDGGGDLLPSFDSGLVHVRPVVRVSPSRSTVSRGQAASVLVQVRPARPGQTVTVTQALQGTTVRLASGKQDRNGAVRLTLGTGQRGTYAVQATAYQPGFYGGIARVPFTVR